MSENARGGGDHIEGNVFGSFMGNLGSGGTYVQYGSNAPVADVDKLIELMSRHGKGHQQNEEAIVAAEELKAQLSRDEPDSGRIRDLLARVAAVAGSVAGVTEALERIRSAFEGRTG